MKKGKTTRFVHISRLLLCGLVLSGCQNHQTESSSVNTAKMGQAAHSDGDNALSQCQQELVALSKINPTAYNDRRLAFDGLLKSAALYGSVRKDINDQTKSTVDALYKFKTQKLCQQVEQDINQTLIDRGENLK